MKREGRALAPFIAVAAAALVMLLIPPFADKGYDWWAAALGLMMTAALGAVLMLIPPGHWAVGVPPEQRAQARRRQGLMRSAAQLPLG